MGPTKRESRKIIDSKVPAGKGCVRSQVDSVLPHTDGWFRNPANSPVEVGSLTQGFSSIPGGEPSTALTHLRSLVPWDEVGHPGGVPRFRVSGGQTHQPPPTSTNLSWGNRIGIKMAYYNEVYQETWLLKVLFKSVSSKNQSDPKSVLPKLWHPKSEQHIVTYVYIYTYMRIW